ncbi:Alpha/beta-hydrolase [Coniochaeta hoffmannii]|uniref:Alpha/beta-hydrolase n=1 Tax=Coniochaeta hoffmannii TaxID=91930 RepID=A0AA38VMG3_9PEZI|nr:Alpha/beta-hydrolase [Coniochaeta hoffmannii]
MAAPTTQFYELRDFTFHDGTTLSSARLAYVDINPTVPKTALVITCFRGRLTSTLTFADGALRDHRVIVAALFGNGESSSPSNTQGFPSTIDYRDCVRAQHSLLTSHLDIPSPLDVVVGFSMGGQCAYYWTLMYPDLVRSAVMICSSARTSRHNYQFLEGPKAALQNAVDYVDRDRGLPESGGVSRGLRAFGKAYSAWLTSAEWFDQRAYTTLGYRTLSDWDAATTGAGYVGWDADDLLAKLHMWQAGDVSTLVDGPGELGEDELFERALSQIKARVLLMPCRTDQYFRPEASEREARWIPGATLKVIPSIWGHIAGSGANKVDTEWIDRAIAEFLAG